MPRATARPRVLSSRPFTRRRCCTSTDTLRTTQQPKVERYGYDEQAERLRNTIVSLCKEQGFYEYYDPTTGFGHGSDLFSWTAALFLDVVLED